jgi:biopolymer transport protein ExbD
MNPGLLPAASDPVSQPVIVQVLDNGTGEQPGVYVNSKVASWGRLDSALMGEVKLHPKWIVYVEADAKVGWADVANAIDVAKGLQASGSVYKLEV